MAAAASKKYFYAVGRRKQATAVVKLFPKGAGSYSLKKGEAAKTLKDHFGGNIYMYDNAIAPLVVLGADIAKNVDCEIKIAGGGIGGHSDAIRLGIARALVQMDADYKAQLKPHGFMQRDPRRKERKKPGLKKARKSPTWSKR